MLKQVFIDCMPGPTNHFGGHAFGNMASMTAKGQHSNPKKAALEWIEKINKLKKIGAYQLILPPHRRPLAHYLKHPQLNELSSGFIWMANAGHFIPNSDTSKRYHQFIPANMNATYHRKYEHMFNTYWIKQILKNIPHQLHGPLSSDDEGAANTVRLWNKDIGIHVAVYGHKNTHFPSRQNEDSIKELQEKTNILTLFKLQQKSIAIDHGVFHNDVICFGFKNTLFCHEHAFENQNEKLNNLKKIFHQKTNENLTIIEIKESELTLDECISTYLFNSQVIIQKNNIILLCPSTVKRNNKSLSITNQWQQKGYFSDVQYIDIKSSLMNGGGPACLRLCMYLNGNEIKKIPKQFWASENKIKELTKFINTEYPQASS